MEMKKMMDITRNFGNDRRRFNRKLKKAGIKFEWHHCYDGYQWTFDGCTVAILLCIAVHMVPAVVISSLIGCRGTTET